MTYNHYIQATIRVKEFKYAEFKEYLCLIVMHPPTTKLGKKCTVKDKNYETNKKSQILYGTMLTTTE